MCNNFGMMLSGRKWTMIEQHHFIGSIIYIHEELYQVSTVTKDLLVIDGQQRLTTVSFSYWHLQTMLKLKKH